jgi:hypothetical protein
MKTIFASPQMQIGVPIHMVGSEDTNEFVVVGYDGTIEHSAGVFNGFSSDDRILVISPHNIGTTLRFILPGHIGQAPPYNRPFHVIIL